MERSRRREGYGVCECGRGGALVGSKADLQVESERIRPQIVNAKYDLLKWGVAAAVGLILAAVYTLS